MLNELYNTSYNFLVRCYIVHKPLLLRQITELPLKTFEITQLPLNFLLFAELPPIGSYVLNYHQLYILTNTCPNHLISGLF
jgi:hypothetical protein